MKKAILLFVASLCTATMFSQEVVVYNGEDVDFTWTQFVYASDKVENEVKDAVNGTDYCMRVARINDDGQFGQEFWGGAIYHSLDIPNVSDYGFISMMVRKDIEGLSRLEIQSAGEIQKYMTNEVNYTNVGQWQNLIFNLEANTLAGEAMTTALVSIHFQDERLNPDFVEQYMYFDQITLLPKFTDPNYNDGVSGSLMFSPFLVDALEVENPDKTGENTTNKCMEINRIKNTEMWAGMRSPRLNVNLTGDSKITMMVKKDVAGPVMIELQTKNESVKKQLTADYDNVGEWQQVEFTIPTEALEGQPLGIILIAPHYADTQTDATYTDQIMYIDEINFESFSSSTDVVPFDPTQVVYSELYDITGKYMKKFGKNDNIDLSNLPKGIYVLKQTDANGNISSEKMVR